MLGPIIPFIRYNNCFQLIIWILYFNFSLRKLLISAIFWPQLPLGNSFILQLFSTFCPRSLQNPGNMGDWKISPQKYLFCNQFTLLHLFFLKKWYLPSESIYLKKKYASIFTEKLICRVHNKKLRKKHFRIISMR